MSGPPYDGKPCPCCPEEIRHLYAVAYNISIGSRGSTIQDLKDALERLKPLIDAHFADPMHALGRFRG